VARERGRERCERKGERESARDRWSSGCSNRALIRREREREKVEPDAGR